MRFSRVAGAALAMGHAAVAGKIAPKVVVISMFTPEANVWYEKLPSSGLGDLNAVNVTTPGLSMLFPHVHCVEDYSICQVTTGEAEINAAATVTALVLSDKFDLTETYFLLAGIAGVNPARGALGSAALARYAVQVALQYEFDPREMPDNFTTGYFGYGSYGPGQYPTTTYGTEVFELNANLRDLAYEFALNANLSSDPEAMAYGDRYADVEDVDWTVATQGPAVEKCDAATSDVYYSGGLLGEAFDNVTELWTNGTGAYCMSAQEDNATLEVMVRAAIEGLVDFGRIMLMRTGSDFDRPPPGITVFEHLRSADQNGFGIAVDNIYNVGVEIIRGILKSWDCTFKKGVKADNYIGDIFGSLGGEPDFGLGSITGGDPVDEDGKTGDLARRGVAAPRSRAEMTRPRSARKA